MNANKFIKTIDEMKKNCIIGPNTKVFASHISHEGIPPHNEFVLFAERHGYDVAYGRLEVVV